MSSNNPSQSTITFRGIVILRLSLQSVMDVVQVSFRQMPIKDLCILGCFGYILDPWISNLSLGDTWAFSYIYFIVKGKVFISLQTNLPTTYIKRTPIQSDDITDVVHLLNCFITGTSELLGISKHSFPPPEHYGISSNYRDNCSPVVIVDRCRNCTAPLLPSFGPYAWTNTCSSHVVVRILFRCHSTREICLQNPGTS